MTAEPRTVSRERTGGPSSKTDVPRHVAIIMDGNGRWATQRGRPRTAGHLAGAKTVRTIVEHARAVDLIVGDGRCTGVGFLLDDGTSGIAAARAVLLVTGGAGQVFSDTTNPPVATGDGLAVAWRAGARAKAEQWAEPAR